MIFIIIYTKKISFILFNVIYIMQKWQVELYDSPMWLLQTFIGVVIALVISIFVISKTHFGKQFWQILRPCLDKKSGQKIILLISLMILLLLTEVRLNVLNTFFYNGLYSALQDAQAQAFWFFALINAGVVGLRTLNAIINDFLDQAVAIKWSEKLNAILIKQWLSNKNYYRLQMRGDSPDNIDQRIQQDTQDFITSTIEFVRGMLNSVISAMEFTIVLWGLSGILSVFGLQIPRGMVFFVFIFVILSTAGAMWIGRPLIRYNFENEKLNGDYRYSLIRVRDHAESIAFYGGEWQENKKLSQRFTDIIRNRWKITRQSVSLNGFNDLLTQGVQLLPLMLQAPRFFSGQIKIGDMHQTVQAFNRLQRALSFFRNFYEEFTEYQARLERLSGFMTSMQKIQQLQQPNYQFNENNLIIQNLNLYLPQDKILLSNINFTVKQGESLLIQGNSGCGKTSLLRTIAGLWSFGSSGNIYRPAHDKILFIPQRAYVPEGSLRQAICYPSIDLYHADLEKVLVDCHLAHLIAMLDIHKDWQHTLSPGELQRVAFARILLSKPALILLDEATSALDEVTEASLYRLINERLSSSIIVSIGHRGTLVEFHQRCLKISG